MSLVHDALEKAKREASAKSARELGLAEPNAGQPFRARRRLHPAAVAGIAVFATLLAVFVGLAVVGSRIRAREAKVAAEANAAEAKQPIETSPAGSTTPAATAPAAHPVAGPTEQAAPPTSAASAAVPTPAPPSSAASPNPKPVEATPPPQPSITSATPTNPAPSSIAAPAPKSAIASSSATKPTSVAGDARSYVRELALPDGTVIRLGGIAWSEEAPLAYLNGKLYQKGESVQGLRLARIDRDRVLLEGAGGRYTLRLR